MDGVNGGHKYIIVMGLSAADELTVSVGGTLAGDFYANVRKGSFRPHFAMHSLNRPAFHLHRSARRRNRISFFCAARTHTGAREPPKKKSAVRIKFATGSVDHPQAAISIYQITYN